MRILTTCTFSHGNFFFNFFFFSFFFRVRVNPEVFTLWFREQYVCGWKFASYKYMKEKGGRCMVQIEVLLGVVDIEEDCIA